MNNLDIKEKIVSGEYKISDKRGRSKVWDCFSIIKNENDIEIENFVVCKSCNNVYKYNKNSLSNLNKHKCYSILQNEKDSQLIEPNNDAKKACTEIMTEWVVGDIRPYSLVKDRGLKSYSKLLLSLGSKFGANLNVDSLLPHPTTLYRNVENSYATHFAKLKCDISAIRNVGYALTCDLWSENYSKISYLALTVHFIVDGDYKSKLLGVKSMKGILNTGKLLVI